MDQNLTAANMEGVPLMGSTQLVQEQKNVPRQVLIMQETEFMVQIGAIKDKEVSSFWQSMLPDGDFKHLLKGEEEYKEKVARQKEIERQELVAGNILYSIRDLAYSSTLLPIVVVIGVGLLLLTKLSDMLEKLLRFFWAIVRGGSSQERLNSISTPRRGVTPSSQQQQGFVTPPQLLLLRGGQRDRRRRWLATRYRSPDQWFM